MKLNWQKSELECKIAHLDQDFPSGQHPETRTGTGIVDQTGVETSWKMQYCRDVNSQLML